MFIPQGTFSRLSGLVFGLALALAWVDAPSAGNLVYQPTNPAFGGSPLNGSWLNSEATAQNEFVRKEQRRNQIRSEKDRNNPLQQSPGQLFARQLQSQLYSSLANKITASIFGENAQQSGTFAFEGTVINFRRVGPNVEVTINDGESETTVTVPASAP